MRIFVFFHVEVDELGTLHPVFVRIRKFHCLPVECRHTVYQFGEAFFIVQRMGLRINAGYLDGNIVDVGCFQCFQIVVVAVVGLSVAQYYLAQQVDVLSYLLLEPFGQMFRQLGPRFVQDDFGGIHAETLLYNRYGNEVEMMPEGLVHLEEESVSFIQELRDAVAVYQRFDACRQFLAVAYLRRFVQHFHQKAFVLRTLHHDGVFMLFLTLFVGNGLFARVIKLQYPFLYFGYGWSGGIHIVSNVS